MSKPDLRTPVLSPAPVAAALLTLSARAAGATFTLPFSASGISASVDVAARHYEVSCNNPPWTFSGTFQTALAHAAVSAGHDRLGHYRQIAFEWEDSQTPMSGRIRVYDERPVAIFSQNCGMPRETPPPAFPSFTKFPSDLHIFSHGLREFAPPRFEANNISTPWLLFDDAANAFIISPASHFMVASMEGDARAQIASGFNPNLRGLPSGFTQDTMIVFEKGINRAWDAWGKALVDLRGAKRPSNEADAILKYFGYWTDNGAAYYYNYDADKGYTGTLEALLQRFLGEQIPIRYLQLDSWWYSKSTTGADGVPGKSKKSDKLPEGEWNRYGGALEYKAHPFLFPEGLAPFQKSIDMPLVTHARWIDPASPYHEKFKTSGLAILDPKWWNQIASYLHASGVGVYEQDWLDRIYNNSPAFTSNAAVAETFLDNMARACRDHGISVQYCMPYAAHFMQGCGYENLTTIRTSGDRFNVNHWNDFLYTSRLARSLGIWPWADLCKSAETQNVLLMTLSAGAVGIGDAMGAETITNISQAVRADGVIVKPDVSIVPLDSSYVADAQRLEAPLVAATRVTHEGAAAAYVFAFSRPKTRGGPIQFTLGDLGLAGPAYVFDYFGRTAQRLENNAVFASKLGRGESAYFVVAPIGESGIAFLGDQDKFVGLGKKRIASVKETSGKLEVAALLAKTEETITLHGYAPTAPTVEVHSGSAGPVAYDPATQRFSVAIKADMREHAVNDAGDPVRRVGVTIFLEAPK